MLSLTKRDEITTIIRHGRILQFPSCLFPLYNLPEARRKKDFQVSQEKERERKRSPWIGN